MARTSKTQKEPFNLIAYKEQERARLRDLIDYEKEKVRAFGEERIYFVNIRLTAFLLLLTWASVGFLIGIDAIKVLKTTIGIEGLLSVIPLIMIIKTTKKYNKHDRELNKYYEMLIGMECMHDD